MPLRRALPPRGALTPSKLVRCGLHVVRRVCTVLRHSRQRCLPGCPPGDTSHSSVLLLKRHCDDTWAPSGAAAASSRQHDATASTAARMIKSVSCSRPGARRAGGRCLQGRGHWCALDVRVRSNDALRKPHRASRHCRHPVSRLMSRITCTRRAPRVRGSRREERQDPCGSQRPYTCQSTLIESNSVTYNDQEGEVIAGSMAAQRHARHFSSRRTTPRAASSCSPAAGQPS